MAPIAVGDKIPLLLVIRLQQASIHSLAAGKKIILLGVPGAFTPPYSQQHVAVLVEKAKELKAKGVDDIILISVNDPFVMREWAKTYPNNNKHVKFYADGSAKYTSTLGMELDLSEKGMGIRSRRTGVDMFVPRACQSVCSLLDGVLCKM